MYMYNIMRCIRKLAARNMIIYALTSRCSVENISLKSIRALPTYTRPYMFILVVIGLFGASERLFFHPSVTAAAYGRERWPKRNRECKQPIRAKTITVCIMSCVRMKKKCLILAIGPSA